MKMTTPSEVYIENGYPKYKVWTKSKFTDSAGSDWDLNQTIWEPCKLYLVA